MSKHTQGPWRWDGNPCSYDASNEAPWLVSAANGADAILKGQIECTSEEAARLIEAAPELLQALKTLLPIAEDAFTNSSLQIEILDAHAAIAKATGEKQ